MRFYLVSDIQALHMPAKRFFMLNRQIRRLEALETLRAGQAASFPHLTEDGHRQMMDELQRELELGNVAPAAQPKLATRESLASMGIAVIEVGESNGV